MKLTGGLFASGFNTQKRNEEKDGITFIYNAITMHFCSSFV